MSKSQILTKAISTAIIHGWAYKDMDIADWKIKDGFLQGHMPVENTDVLVNAATYLKPFKRKIDKDFLFDHDFAKALWGEEITFVDEMRLSHGGNVVFEKPAWQAHLQQMVVADDPIHYIGENL